MARPALGQLGSQLNLVLATFDGMVLNPDIVTLPEYERMLNTDETVKAAYSFLTLAVAGFLGGYHHPDARIARFVNEQLTAMEGTLGANLEDILSLVWAGFSVTEIVWAADGARIKAERLVTYHPQTITFQVTEQGRLQSVIQRRLYAAGEAVLPPEKCIIANREARFGNYYGTSAFKAIRKNWLLKDAFLKMWGRALDKFGTPLVVAIVPDSDVKDPETGEEVHQLDYAIKVLSTLQNGTALAFAQSGTGQGASTPDVKALTTGAAGVGDAFNQAVGYLNKMICRGLLIPSLVFDEGVRSGSYALGASHFDAFFLSARALYQRLADTLVEQFIRRLIEYNYGPQADGYGNFAERPPDPETLKILAEGFVQLVNAGMLDPQTDEDMRWARSKLGLPDRPVAGRLADGDLARDYPRYLRAGGD
ncbi:MAG: DUF935 family protein [Bacillota bacterium]|nr:DUF935 family protein [Bacillota bacterium]